MIHKIELRQRIRKSFQHIDSVVKLPSLIEIQLDSYESFMQRSTKPEDRKDEGLQAVFNSVFPIKDFSGKSQLEFVSYEFGEPEYDVEECKYRGLTYEIPLRATFRLIVWDIDEETGAKSIRDIKEQTVYLGDMPDMTENGTFIINGVERVVVSQMHRSPGVFFDHDGGKNTASGKYLYSARVIPYRGSWLDFEFDARDNIYVRIDRKRKILLTTFLKCLDNEETEKLRKENDIEYYAPSAGLPFEVKGLSNEDILNRFYDSVSYKKDKKGWRVTFNPDHYQNVKLENDLIDAKSGEVLAEAGKKISPRAMRKLVDSGVKEVLLSPGSIIGKFLAHDYIDSNTGEVLAEAGDELTEELVTKLVDAGNKSIDVLNIDGVNHGPYILQTLKADKAKNREDALLEVYRVLRPGEPPTLESAEILFKSLFFESDKYDLSAVGRIKMNARVGSTAPDTCRILLNEDILNIVKTLVDLRDGRGQIDDIDNLANRRVRAVGELLENQYRIGLLRMERSVRERMSSADLDSVMPNDLINAKPAAASIKEFFGSSQLSQFMDQTNPLSEITHKRRLSALGPGGLSRERAGFEVRDVHPTHYGRICPIETPEGPNIGLINSLATFARVNKYGLIETPYRKVKDGVVTNEIEYMSAVEEWKHTIAQASSAVDKNGKLVDEFVSARRAGEYVTVPASEVDLMDVSPKQLVSVATSLIPFLENDDANRALMGSNMQRQAVPLLRTAAPMVGTGMEADVAKDSGVVVVAKNDGEVVQVDANRIVVRTTPKSKDGIPGADVYNLEKFQRTNHSTCINQKPLARVGDKVKAGDILADGPSTDDGELALGQNPLVAFLSWNGCNFEDSIIISEKVVADDMFTSIHIEEFEVIARDTKLGHEEITRDIPNVGDEALRHLDEAGIVTIGAEVAPGDILVGKVTPKGESPMTPEEKLLRAIFGERAADVKDSSLRVPSGTYGTVVDVRVFNRRGVEKDERSLAIEQAKIDEYALERDAERNILENVFMANMKDMLSGQVFVSGYSGFKKGQKLTKKDLEGLGISDLRRIVIEDEKLSEKIEAMKNHIDTNIKKIQQKFTNRVEKLRRGDELQAGVLKMVKVFLAVKRKLQPGDKMSGRHGNKGVVSYVAPVEDLPFMEDGTPIDVVLNPLGIPSRMNVGQILETHLGFAAKGLGKQIEETLRLYREKKVKIDGIRNALITIYEKDEYADKIKNMSDEEVLYLAEKLKDGVPMATPVFDGAKLEDIDRQLELAGLDKSAQVQLYDGKTGEAFDNLTTVGYMYVLKLHHLVDDKLHARSIGPYSLVTQQPLGGKAQFGGQRFGEMEVWALEAYGAAYTLQEMLTVKSDDVEGRTKVYESIIRGDDDFESGVPESFNVLVKELRSLGLNMDFGKKSAA